MKEENEMKRIDISKKYRDCNLVINNETTHVEVIKFNGHFLLFKVCIGKDHLTLTQANTILAPFGYELYSSTDWSEVEVGTEVKFTKEFLFSWNLNGTRINLDNLKFKEWIPQTQQIIIFNGNKVEVYNEYEVELVWKNIK